MKILKQANPYIKPANERAFPRCANRGNARFRVATNAETRVSAFVLIAPVAPKIKPAYTLEYLEYIVLGISCTK